MRRAMAAEAVKPADSLRVSEKRARIVEMILRNMMKILIPPYTMYPTERQSKPYGGVKNTMIVAGAVVAHCRMRATITALSIEVGAPGGNQTFLAGRVEVTREADLS